MYQVEQKTKISQGTVRKTFVIVALGASLFALYAVIIPLKPGKHVSTTAIKNDTDVLTGEMTALKNLQTQSRKTDIVNLLAATDRAIIGQIIEKRNVVVQEPTPTELGAVVTEYDITVLQALAGSVQQGEHITLRHSGGTLPAGNRVILDGMPILNTNGVYLMLLSNPGSPSPFVGLEQGVFRIFQQASTYVVTDFLGQPTMLDATRIWRPATPLTVIDFVEKLSQSKNVPTALVTDAIFSGIEIPSYSSIENTKFSDGITYCDGLKWESPPAYLTTNHSFTGENDKYNAVSYAAMDQISRVTTDFSFILARDDSLGTDPFIQDEVGMWYPNFIADEILVGNMGRQGICSENSSIICDEDADCEPDNGTCEHISSPLSTSAAGTTSCYEDPDHPGKFLAASMALDSDVLLWNMSYGQAYIEEVEQNSQNYQPSSTGYPLYAQVVAHELLHAIGHGHYYGADGNDELTTMLPTVTPLPKLWGYDEATQEELYGADIEENVFSSNFYKSWEDEFTPIEPLPPGAQVGSTVNYGIVVGHNGYHGITFNVGAYWVQYDSWGDSSTWQVLDNFSVSLTKSNTTSTLSRTFIMPANAGYLMVVADPDNEIAESDELDNGQRWPRLDQSVVGVNGGWLYLESGSDYGDNYNIVRLTRDEDGFPSAAQLSFSTAPYPVTPGPAGDAARNTWFANATTPVSSSELVNPTNYSDGWHLEVTLSLSNNQTYYVALREIRNGETQWEYFPPPDGSFEVENIYTGSCAMQVVYPNGGESFLPNDSVTIQWNRPGRCMDSAKLELYRNSTLCFTINSSTLNTGHYTWAAAQCGGQVTGYKVKVTDNSTSSSDQSDAVFSITGAPPPQSTCAITPATASINAGTTQYFSLACSSGGQSIPCSYTNWSTNVGTMNPTQSAAGSTLTAQTAAGSGYVSASYTYSGHPELSYSCQASITILAHASCTITPATASVSAGATRYFSLACRSSGGQVVPCSFTNWYTNVGTMNPTQSAAGSTLTAQSVAGQGYVRASYTNSNPANSYLCNASVTVSMPPPPAGCNDGVCAASDNCSASWNDCRNDQRYECNDLRCYHGQCIIDQTHPAGPSYPDVQFERCDDGYGYGYCHYGSCGGAWGCCIREH